jgi:uroporphyrinogen-III synthase
LLLHPALQSVADEKILIVRGVGGRGYLADELRRRGAKVDFCEVYQRNITANAYASMTTWINNQQAWVDQQYLVAFHSSETWNYFCDLAGKIQASSAEDVMSKLRSLPILVPSARVENEVNKSGFHHTILAKNATDEAMTQAVNHFIRSNPA